MGSPFDSHAGLLDVGDLAVLGGVFRQRIAVDVEAKVGSKSLRSLRIGRRGLDQGAEVLNLVPLEHQDLQLGLTGERTEIFDLIVVEVEQGKSVDLRQRADVADLVVTK